MFRVVWSLLTYVRRLTIIAFSRGRMSALTSIHSCVCMISVCFFYLLQVEPGQDLDPIPIEELEKFYIEAPQVSPIKHMPEIDPIPER